MKKAHKFFPSFSDFPDFFTVTAFITVDDDGNINTQCIYCGFRRWLGGGGLETDPSPSLETQAAYQDVERLTFRGQPDPYQ